MSFISIYYRKNVTNSKIMPGPHFSGVQFIIEIQTREVRKLAQKHNLDTVKVETFMRNFRICTQHKCQHFSIAIYRETS